MQCVIPVEQLRKFRVKIGKDIQTILEQEGTTFDLKNFLSNLYSEILSKSGDKDLALDYIKVAPLFMEQVLSGSDDMASKLLDQSFDFNNLKRQVLKFNSDNGIKEAIDFLGLEQNIAEELEELQQVLIEEPEEEKPMPEGDQNVFGPMQNVDINGDPIVVQRNGIFSAYALNFLSDAEWETYSIKPGEKGYNVVDPTKAFYFNVKKNILGALRGLENGSEMNFKGIGPIFLKAVEVSTLDAKDKKSISSTDKITQVELDKAIAMVVVDQTGKMLRFDTSTGELLENGTPAYFYMRGTDKFFKDGKFQLDKYEKDRATALSKNLGITQEEAETYIERQVKSVASIRNFIKQNPQDNSVTLNITGGSEGYPNFDFRVKTPVKDITNNFTVDVEKATGGAFRQGQFFITLEGSTAMPLEINAPALKDTKYIEPLITLLTEDVYDQYDNLLSTDEKNKIIDTYLYTHDERVNLTPSGKLKLRGNALDISTPENKARAQQQLRDYFTTLTEVKKIKPNQIGNRRVVPFRSEYKLNDVTQDENGNYWVIENIKLNGKDRIGSNFNDIIAIEKDDQGRMVIQTENRPFNEFVKENWVTPYILNDQNQIVKVQSYLTYDVTQEDLAKLDTVQAETTADVDAIQPGAGVLTKNDFTTPEDAYQQIKTNGEANFKKMYKVFLNAIENGSISTENARKTLDLWNERQNTEGEPKLTPNQYKALDKAITADETGEFEKPVESVPEDVQVKEVEDLIKDTPVDTADAPYTNTNPTDFDMLDWLDDNANDPTLQKNYDQKNVNIQATKEQIAQAKKWYEESPLSKVFPFEAMFNLINTNDPNSVATWAMHGIRLYQGSDFSDLYHEAYHGFSQAFMTKEQRADVYGAVRKLKGTFRDHNGKTQQFATANDLQVEEYLAEGFRKYMLSDRKTVTPSAKVNSFFEILMNILDALFGNLTFNEVFSDQSSNDKINNIYEKLRVGNLTQYSFNESNPSFGTLNAGIRGAEDSGEVRTELSYEDSADVMDMIDSMISDAIDINNTMAPLTREERSEYLQLQAQVGTGSLQGVDLANAKAKLDAYNNNPNKTNSFTSTMVNTVSGRTRTFKYVKAQLGLVQVELSKKFNNEKDSAVKAHLGKKIDTLRWVLNEKNFGDLENLANNLPDETGAVKGVIGYYMQKSKRFLEDITEQIYGAEATTEEEIMLKGREVNSLSNEHSSQDLAKKDILFLLKSLHEVGDDSKPVYNGYGVKKLVDFSEVWNKVAVTLENNLDPAVMFSRLEELAKSYPPVKQLLSKIGSPLRGNISDTGQTLWSNFVAAFNLTRAPLLQMTIEKTANDRGQVTYKSKVGVSFGSFKKIGSTWESEFQRTFTNPFIKSDEQGNYLDTDAVLAKYPTANSIENKEIQFLNDIGLPITNNEVIEQLLREGDASLGIKPKLGEFFYNTLTQVNGFQKQSTEVPLMIRSIKDLISEYKDFGKKGNDQGRLNTLLQIELQFGDQRSNFMVQNAEGNTQFEHMLNNTLSMIINSINAAKDYDSLVALPHMSYLDITRNPNAKYSTMLNSIFQMDQEGNEFGKRRQFDGKDVKLDFNNLAGAALYDLEGESDGGVAAAKADEFSKFIMDFHMANNENGFVAEMMRHSDKSTSFAAVLSKIFGLGTGNKAQNTYVIIEDFIGDSNTHVKSTYDYVQNYLYAEHERIKHMEQLQKEANKDPNFVFDYKFMAQGQTFQVFNDIFDTQLKADLLKIDNLKEAFDKNLDPQLRKRVYNSIADYFKKQSDSVEAKFMQAEFIAGSMESMMQRKFSEKNVQITRPAMRRALIESMVANTWIHNVETVNMFYGDLAMYNHMKQEFHKRNAGIGSTGTVFRTDKSMLDYINGRVKRGYGDKLGIAYDNYNGQLNTAIIQDIDSRSALYDEYADAQREAFVKQFKNADPNLTDKVAIERANIKLFGEKGTQPDPAKDGIMYGYMHMNEADAQGYITFDMYRIMAISQGEWDFKTQEKIYQAIINGENIDQTQMSDLFPPAKYQYWGPLATSDIPVMAFHKYSLAPIIPGTYKEGGNMDKLHKTMMTQKVDYLTFQSGSKVGTLTAGGKADQFYDPKTRSVNENITFTKNVIYANYLKNQLKIHKHFKESITFPTQLRKLIEDGLMEFGVPVGYETSLSKDERIKSWDALPLDKKLENQNYRLVKTYESHITQLTEMKKQKLLQKMGLKQENGIISGDQTKLWNFVKNELTRQDLADHEIDFIKVVNGQLQYDLSMSLSAEKIEKLLNSIITRTLVKQKFHGEGLYQLASAMFEGTESTERFTNPTEADLELWGTNDLPTYRVRNGKTMAAKVKIALQGDFEYLFYLNHSDGKQIAIKNEDGTLDYNSSLDRLNEMLRDEAWLDTDNHRSMITMVGVRIPTQGLNSMEFMEVYQFLPKTASNVIILPAEIVAKSGADFDIDKLTVLMPNLSKSYKTDVPNDALKELQTANPELDFSRKNVGRLINAIKNDQEESFTPEDRKVVKAIEQFTTTEVSYKTNDSEKGLENNIITDIKNILELPENFASLTRPNGTDILDPIQAELADEVNEYDPSFTYQSDNKLKKGQISPTRVLEIEYNLYKHYTNNIGKQTLGLGAVDNTFNTLLTRINAYMNPKTADGVKQELYLPHVSIKVDGEDAISLASIMDANGEFRISDIINQMINGWVDIAKDAWIFNIQGNKEISPTLLFMVQAGVPIEQAVYFVSIPSVREYVKEQKKFKSLYSEALGYGSEPEFAKSNAADRILSRLGYDKPEKMKRDKFVDLELATTGIKSFDLKDLKDVVRSKTKPSEETSQIEKAAFLHFLQVERMATAVRDVKLRMNLDTAESKSLFEASDRLDLIQELRESGRMNVDLVDKLLTESPIGSFAIQDFQLEVWKDAFPLRNHPVFNKILSKVVTSDFVKETLGDKERTILAVKNDLLSYVFQNSFNTASITVDGIDDIKAYRGYSVAGAEQREVLVKENEGALRFGAFMKDNVMYIDKNRIITDFNEMGYSKTSTRYKSNLLAPVDDSAFTTIDEYTKFVLEREYLRGTLDLNALKETPEFKNLKSLAEEKEWYPQRDTETSEVYKSRVNRNIMEMLLRDKALDNSFNHWKIFQSNDTYAHQFSRIKSDYPSLIENFPLLQYFDISKNDKNYTNIKMRDIQTDGNMLNRIHQMFIKLTQPQELGIEDPKQAQEVANFFRKFPIIGFMQSGLSTRGKFATGRFLPQEILLGLMEAPVKEFKKYLDQYIGSNKTPAALTDFVRLFKQNNSRRNFSSMSRGKNYKTDYKLQEKTNKQVADAYKKVIQSLTYEEIQFVLSGDGRSAKDLLTAQQWVFDEFSVLFDGADEYLYNFKYALTPEAMESNLEISLANYGGFIEAAQAYDNLYNKIVSNVLSELGIPVNTAVAAKTATTPQSTKVTSEITSSNYSRPQVENDPNTAYVFTENNYSITAFPNRVGGGSAIIRGLANAFAIVTKKKYDYNTRENVDYSDTDANFQEFVDVNTKLINDLKNSGKSKIVFPQGFATDKAKMPERFAIWLQQALLDNFGLVTELNSAKTGLISKSTTQPSTSVKPTIDTSREWSGDLKTRPVYTPEGVNTMRTEVAKKDEHFGNPFSEAGYGDTIKVSSIGAAVRMYKDWLLNNAVTDSEIVSGSVNDLAKFDNQRAWILDQINQGKLDGATLLYAGKSAARGEGMHPTALAEVVEILRSSKLGISSEKKKVLKNEKGLIIIDNAIPLKQTQEIVEDSKKFIEDTSFKQTNGSVSWGYGMQWIRSSALTPKQKEGVQVGKQLGGDEITQDMVDRLKKGLPVKMPLYVYTIYDKNGNRLPNIPSNIINLLQEQGIDVSQYDASYNSVYDKNDKGSLIVHQDNTEFNTSPIITVSLGRPMKFITYQLKDPGNYSFGTNAKNRYELILNTISNKLQAQNLAPELKRQKNFQGNMVIAYGELTPGNLAKYAKMVGEESAALDALSDSIEKIEEHTLTNGAVLVFSNQNRNVFHEIIFDEQTDAAAMPEGFPELTINKAYKGLGHADKMVKTKDYRVVLTLRKVNGTTSIDSVDTNKLVSKPAVQPQIQTTGTNNPSNFKNFSGGQTDGSITKGGDTAWYETGKEFGVENHTFYKPQDFDALDEDAKSQLNTQYAEVVSFLGRGILKPETTAGKLVRRDMMQANSADAIYGVTTLIAPGKTDRSGKYPNRKAYITPDGGTGYALARGILSNKPVYVYNQSNSQGVDEGWYKWENGNFVKTTTPVLSKNFAGVGTRELNEKGKQAIKDVYANTFKKNVQLTGQVKPGVDFVYEQTPELERIGTKEQYSRYLESYFPNNKVTTIGYRGSQNPNKLEASDLDPEKGTGARNLGKGIYIAKDKAFADKYSGTNGRTTAFLVNVPNFQVIALQKNWDRGYWSADNVTVRDLTNNTSDVLINFEGLDKDNYVEFNNYTGKYTGPVDENGFPTYQENLGKTPEWTQLAVQSNTQVLPLGSKQDKDAFQAFVVEESMPTGPLTDYVSIEDLQKNPIFEGMVINFLKEIPSNRDKPIPLKTPKGKNIIDMVADLMYQKYEEKAWTVPATQRDGSKATPLAENQFGSYNEFLTFALLHEKAHKYILKQENETVGQYEDRINDEAMRRLNEIPNKEVKNDRVIDQEQVVVTDEMIQDFMFNVCK